MARRTIDQCSSGLSNGTKRRRKPHRRTRRNTGFRRNGSLIFFVIKNVDELSGEIDEKLPRRIGVENAVATRVQITRPM